MLILSRKLNESIVIDGRIIVKVVRVEGDIVKLGIAAPAEVQIHRQEVYEEIRKSNREALTRRSESVPKLSQGAAPIAAAPASGWMQDGQLNPDTECHKTKPNQT